MIMMTEIRGASNDKAKRELGWELRYPSWRLGFREERTRAERGRVNAELLDDLRPRAFAIAYRMLGIGERGRGRRAGGAAPRARRRSRARRGDLLAARLRRRPSRPGWRSTSCARPAPAARPTSANGCPSRCDRGPGRRSRRRRPSWPTRSRSPSSCCSSRLTPEQRAAFLLHDVFDYGYARGRRDHRHERGQRSPARLARPPPRAGGQAALRRLGARSASSSRTASSPRRRAGTSRRSRRCSPTTSSCTATAAGWRRRSSTRSSAAPGRSDARQLDAARASRRSAAWSSAGRLVNGHPGAEYLRLGRQADRRHVARHRRRAGSRRSARSSIREKLGHLGPGGGPAGAAAPDQGDALVGDALGAGDDVDEVLQVLRSVQHSKAPSQ